MGFQGPSSKRHTTTALDGGLLDRITTMAEIPHPRTFETAYFGRVTCSEGSVIQFAQGLPGFEQETRFITIGADSCKPLIFVQSVSTRALCFVTLPVLAIAPDYRLDLQPEDLEALGLPVDARPEIGPELVCLAVVSVNENGPPTANLLAPVVIHLPNQKGVQVVPSDSRWPLRHPLTGTTEAPACS
jgi:flagellar assembly factor FliW